MKVTHSQLAIRSLALSLALASPCRAHTAQHDSHAAEPQDEAFGRPGAAKDITSTIAIQMTDAMRFSPGALTIVQGQTVRWRISNNGKLPHELVLGTQEEIDEHAEMMRKMPGMIHNDASSKSVAPGKSADIIWKFSKSGKFPYACLVPGHLEASMTGTITVTARVHK